MHGFYNIVGHKGIVPHDIPLPWAILFLQDDYTTT